MKNTLLKTFAILLITFSFICCKKKDKSSDTPAPSGTPTTTTGTSDYFLKAKIDGAQYATDAAFRVSTGSSADRITIQSVLSDNRSFEIIIYRPTGTGTYSTPVPAASDYTLRLSYGLGSSATSLYRTGTCTGTSGTVTITSLSSTEISGTFSFIGKRTSDCAEAAKTITEGSFKSGILQ